MRGTVSRSFLPMARRSAGDIDSGDASGWSAINGNERALFAINPTSQVNEPSCVGQTLPERTLIGGCASRGCQLRGLHEIRLARQWV
jgi:hypothetical protein